MPKRSNSPDAGRRNFLKGATLAGAAALTTPVAASTEASNPRTGSVKAAVPGPRLAAAETMPPTKDPVTQTTSGGDFMVDVFKTLDIEYLAMNCASSFRGLALALCLLYVLRRGTCCLLLPHGETHVLAADTTSLNCSDRNTPRIPSSLRTYAQVPGDLLGLLAIGDAGHSGNSWAPMSGNGPRARPITSSVTSGSGMALSIAPVAWSVRRR